MIGQMALCMTCRFQTRIEDNGQETGCTHSTPNVGDDTCQSYRILAGAALGERLAELYTHLDTLADLTYAVLDRLENHLADAQGAVFVTLTDRALLDLVALRGRFPEGSIDDLVSESLSCYRATLDVVEEQP